MATALQLPYRAMAYCPVPQPRLVCAEYSSSPLVIEGTLLRIRSLHEKGSDKAIAAHTYTLKVNQVLRGSISGDVRVYEANDSGRAGFEWTQGEKYLLFLFRISGENSWGLDGCGNSGPLAESSAALREIYSMKSGRNVGQISGMVSRQALSEPIPEVRVEVQGNGRLYAATADKDGKFLINVPAGEFQVRAAKEGFTFRKADISYEDPNRVHIGSRGCAQVQLVGEDNAR